MDMQEFEKYEKRAIDNMYKKPNIHETAYVAEGVSIKGDVTLMEDSSIWENCTLHGDTASITIGKRSSLQELCCVHVGFDKPVVIEDNVTVGHGCIIHGCRIGSNVTVGMGSIILDGAVIGSGSFIGAGALITERAVIPPNSLVVGVPGKVRRETTEEERQGTWYSVEHYVRQAREERKMRSQ